MTVIIGRCSDENSCVTEADLVRVKQLMDLMFVGGLSFDPDGQLINGTRWDYETSIFVGIELLATVGAWLLQTTHISDKLYKMTGSTTPKIPYGNREIPQFISPSHEEIRWEYSWFLMKSHGVPHGYYLHYFCTPWDGNHVREPHIGLGYPRNPMLSFYVHWLDHGILWILMVSHYR